MKRVRQGCLLERLVRMGPNQLVRMAVILPLLIMVTLMVFFTSRNRHLGVRGEGGGGWLPLLVRPRTNLVQVHLRPTLPVHGSGRVHLPPPIAFSAAVNASIPYYGGWEMTGNPPKIIHGPNDKILANFSRPDDQSMVKSYDWYYYAFDDDENRNPYNGYEDPKEADQHHCRRVAWHRDVYPNCNEFHATDMVGISLDNGLSYLG